MFSSRGSEDLSPPDLILLSIQCIAAQEYWKDLNSEDSDEDNLEINRLPCEYSNGNILLNTLQPTLLPLDPVNYYFWWVQYFISPPGPASIRCYLR